MTAKVILNPYANRWIAQKRWPEAEAALRNAGVEFELEVSKFAGHMIDLAEQAVRDGFSPIIAAGGDGTIGGIINGMYRASKDHDRIMVPLGIIPLGSANDFVYNLGLPLDLKSAVDIIAGGKTKLIDLGWVNEHVFVNNSAIGLEPYITLIQQRITWIKGIPRYMIAAVQGILGKPSWQAQIEWDSGNYRGPTLLVTVGNGARTGGVFFMAPHAVLTDGRLTFVYGHRETRREIFRMLPSTMKPDQGSYVEMDGIEENHATWIKIRLETTSPAHVDGEIFTENCLQFEYRILPNRLWVITQ
ncbi:MAG: YegS/Rv2252/BmrU family lipid kinase [Chloroflexota bacterium]